MVETAAETAYIMKKGSGGSPNAKILKNYTILVQSGNMLKPATETVYIMKTRSGGAPTAKFLKIHTISVQSGKMDVLPHEATAPAPCQTPSLSSCMGRLHAWAISRILLLGIPCDVSRQFGVAAGTQAAIG